MPLYEYVCKSCGDRIEVLRSFSKADEEVKCLNCGTPARRVLSVVAAFHGDSHSDTATPSCDMDFGGGCGAGGCACAG